MNKLVNTVRNREWMDMIHRQKESGRTIAAWCRENGISENCYYYRLDKLRKLMGSELPEFVEIKAPAAEKSEDSHIENTTSAAFIQIAGTTVNLTNDASEELIRNTYHLDPYENSLFLFCGRLSDRIKAILWEGSGFCMMYKLLETGRYQWSRSGSELKDLTEQQFRWLTEGLAPEQKKSIPKVWPGYKNG